MNMTVRTVAYSAPEQLMGLDIDGRADQYAFVATADHLLTGSQLFPNSNPAVVCWPSPVSSPGSSSCATTCRIRCADRTPCPLLAFLVAIAHQDEIGAIPALPGRRIAPMIVLPPVSVISIMGCLPV